MDVAYAGSAPRTAASNVRRAARLYMKRPHAMAQPERLSSNRCEFNASDHRASGKISPATPLVGARRSRRLLRDQTVDAGLDHQRTAFRDQRAIGAAGLGPGHPGHACQLATDGRAGASQETARDLTARHLRL